MKTLLAITVLGALAPPAAAQPLGAGLKVGVPLTDALKVRDFPTLAPFAPFLASSSDYTIGPFIELRLPARLAIEVDALYRRYDFSNAGVPSSTSSWEFPVVVKHRLLAGPVKPYFEGGLAFSRLSDIPNVSINHLSSYGLVAGGGVEFNLLLVKIAPEVRYTGWGFRHFDGLAQSQRNQVAFLVGFGF
jgi:opacity protein-like surface antigen